MKRIRRPALGLADQGFSSLTNFATTAIGARYASPSRFGDLALALSVGYMITILTRGLTAEPVIAKCPRLAGEDLRRAERDAVSTALVVGLAAGLAMGALVTLPLRATQDFSWVAVCIPAVLVQDALRYVGFARGRPGAALIADLAWTVVQFSLVAVLISQRSVTLHWIVISWGLGALAGALAGAVALSIFGRGSPRRWISLTSSYSFWILPQLAVSQGTDQGTTLVVITVFGASALGGIRAVQLFVRPVFVFMLALQALLVPALTRRLMSKGRSGLMAHARRLAVGTTVMAMAGGALAVANGRVLSRLVFGPEYVGYAKYMLPFAVGACLHASAALPSAGLRALQCGRRILFVQAVASVATIMATVTTALVATVYATAWATTVQGAVASILGWIALSTVPEAPSPAQATDLPEKVRSQATT